VGVALMRALSELGVQHAALKWPNDVLHAQKKLAGILIELQGDMDGPSAAVIGIGLYLRLPEEMRQDIDQPAASLGDIIDQPAASDEVLAAVLRHLADVLQLFEQHGFSALREEWESQHAYHGQPVRLLMPDGQAVAGVVEGVSGDGTLLVDTGAGLQRFSAGEISLRGGA